MDLLAARIAFVSRVLFTLGALVIALIWIIQS